jgi:hypothetical protein
MVDTLLIKPLPVQDPRALTFLVFPRDATHFDPQFSSPEFHELREQTREVFSAVNAVVLGGLAGPSNHADGLTVDGTTKPAQTLFVTGELFQMLGIRPYLERHILPSDGSTFGRDPVVVLSYRDWKARFHGDAGVLGKTAYLNGRPVTIVGCSSQRFLRPDAHRRYAGLLRST